MAGLMSLPADWFLRLGPFVVRPITVTDPSPNARVAR